MLVCKYLTMLSKSFFVVVLITFIFNVDFSVSQNITISIPNGLLKGKVEATKNNYTFYSFSGVRYAKPPIGILRFKSPVPVEPWNDTYDATYEKNICYQAYDSRTQEYENEDCLFLNIYTPKIYNASLPIMFFIHGGGFIGGFGGLLGRFGPEFFIESGVILVTINYRLGVFGFLSTNDMVIPGNTGLKDQTFALKWIQQNIQYFGGDPNRVTIFGQSAGSASVSYHLLSPLSAGLFRAAIMESGSALSAWAYQRDQRYYTFKTASFIDPNFTSNSSDDLLSLLLNASASDVHAASKEVYKFEKTGNRQLQQGFYYAPVIEPDHDDAFLTQSMYEKFSNGKINKIPTIMGINAEEGLMLYTTTFHNVVDIFNKNGTLLLPRNMHIDDSNPSKDIVIEAIKEMYGIFKNRTYEEQRPGTIRYLTDQCFARSIIKQAELQSNFSDVYFYVFSYDGEMGDHSGGVAGTGNITHSEELNYIFSRTLRSRKNNVDLELFPESDVTTHYRLLKLWTNFAKTLNPTPQPDALFQNLTWPKVDLSNNALQYLDINEDLSVKTNPRWEAYTLWNELYNKYSVTPLDGF